MRMPPLPCGGFDFHLGTQFDDIHRAVVSTGAEPTRLDWVVDSDFRFFPTLPDPEFGYVLHPLDLATNKLLAAATRFEARDAIDVLWIDEHLQPLGAVAWATVEKDPGWMPEGISLTDLRGVRASSPITSSTSSCSQPMTAGELNNRHARPRRRAERLSRRCRGSLEYGALLPPRRRLAQPDADRPETLEGLIVHHGSRKGAWPSSPEIGSIMLRERR